VLQEPAWSHLGQAVDILCSRVEQGDDGIEMTVGTGTRQSASERHPTPALPQSGRLPDGPQDALGGHTGRPTQAVLGVDSAGSADSHSDRPGNPASRPTLRTQHPQRVWRDQTLSEQFVAGPSTAAVELVATQRSPQSPQSNGIGPTDRREQGVDRSLGVDRVRLPHRHVEDHIEQCEQGTDRHLVADGNLGGWNRHRHPGSHENAAQRAGTSLPPDDHGHVGPRHTVQQVRLSQLGSYQRSLLRRRAQQPHIHASALGDLLELAVGSSAECADTSGDAVGHVTQCLGLPV